MTVTLHIPDDAGDVLRQVWGQSLDQAALEALVIEGYRTRRFGGGMVRRLLGLATRWDAEQWLASRNVPLNYDTDDLEADRRALDRLLGKSA